MNRKLQFGAGDASHDPMFPKWMSGFDSLTQVVTPEPPLPLPLPPPNPEAQKWETVLNLAGEVTALLKAEDKFDGMVLFNVVTELLDSNPTTETIIDAYHRRMETRHG